MFSWDILAENSLYFSIITKKTLQICWKKYYIFLEQITFICQSFPSHKRLIFLLFFGATMGGVTYAREFQLSNAAWEDKNTNQTIA